MFEEEKLFVLLKSPFCKQNEVKSKDFIKKFHKFTNNNFRVAISWKTRNKKTLFKIKVKNLYPTCKIYYGVCEHCGDNRVTRWSEHNNPEHKLESVEHIKLNIDHVFNWKILCPGLSQKHLRKNLEAIFVALHKPSLIDQKLFDRLMLFRNGVT